MNSFSCDANRPQFLFSPQKREPRLNPQGLFWGVFFQVTKFLLSQVLEYSCQVYLKFFFFL